MSKQLCNFRIEKEKLKKLKSIAKNSNKDYSKLIREKIDEIVDLDKTDIKLEVLKLIKILREPFAYVKTRPGKNRADKIRNTKKYIINKLEEIFNLANGKT